MRAAVCATPKQQRIRTGEGKSMGEVFEFTVNGSVQRTEEDKPLLRFLRDDLHLFSVKDGCSEGACGTCTIVIDGKAVRP